MQELFWPGMNFWFQTLSLCLNSMQSVSKRPSLCVMALIVSPSNSYVEVLNLTSLRMWPFMEIGSLRGNQVKMKLFVGSQSSMTGILVKRRNLHKETDTHRRKTEWGVVEKTWSSASQRGCPGTALPSQTSGGTAPSLHNWESTGFCCSSFQSVVLCYGSFGKLVHHGTLSLLHGQSARWWIIPASSAPSLCCIFTFELLSSASLCWQVEKMNANCISGLLLCNKLPPSLAVQNNKHLLSRIISFLSLLRIYPFTISVGMWVHLSWVLQLRASHRLQSKCWPAESPGLLGGASASLRSCGWQQDSVPFSPASVFLVEYQLSACHSFQAVFLFSSLCEDFLWCSHILLWLVKVFIFIYEFSLEFLGNLEFVDWCFVPILEKELFKNKLLFPLPCLLSFLLRLWETILYHLCSLCF